MTSYLSFCYSTGLSKSEASAIDTEVSKNRKQVYIFIRNLSCNAKNKTGKGIIIISLSFALCFNNVQPSQAIGLSPIPKPIERVQRSYRRTPMMVRPINGSIFYNSKENLLDLICLKNGQSQIASNPEVLRVIRKLRAGDARSKELLWDLLFLAYFFWMVHLHFSD